MIFKILHGQFINLKYMTEKLIRIQSRVFFQGRYQEFYFGRALTYFSFQEGSTHVGALPLETIDFIDQEGLRPQSPPPSRTDDGLIWHMHQHKIV